MDIFPVTVRLQVQVPNPPRSGTIREPTLRKVMASALLNQTFNRRMIRSC